MRDGCDPGRLQCSELPGGEQRHGFAFYRFKSNIKGLRLQLRMLAEV